MTPPQGDSPPQANARRSASLWGLLAMLLLCSACSGDSNGTPDDDVDASDVLEADGDTTEDASDADAADAADASDAADVTDTSDADAELDVSDADAADTADASDAADADTSDTAEVVEIVCVSTAGCVAEAAGTLCIDRTCQSCDSTEACVADSAYGDGYVCNDGLCELCTPGDLDCECAEGACSEGTCTDGTCVDCEAGALGCGCFDTGTCAPGGACNDSFVCEACDLGSVDCACADGACSEDGIICVSDLCVVDDCEPGLLGCPCGEDDVCEDDSACHGDGFCYACDADAVGCACDPEEDGCSNDLVCGEVEDEDGVFACRDELTCEEVECLAFQLCSDEEEPDGEDATCLESCEEGYVWNAETSSCDLYVAPNCTPDAENSSYATCLAENRVCEVVSEDEVACGGCVDGFVEEEGACRALLQCATVAPGCAEVNRECEPATDTEDATCGDCVSGYELQDDVCTDIVLTCTDGDHSIGAVCAAAQRECLLSSEEGGALDDAECGDCTTGYAEDATGNCAVASYCETLGCDTLGRSCAGDPFAECGECEGGLVPSDTEDPLSLCRGPRSCAETECDTDEYCFESTTGGDATCEDTCPDGQALNDSGTCVTCAIACSSDIEGYTGRTWPVTREGTDTCICETDDGYFYDPSRAALPQPCDLDGDGWVRASAQTFLESADDALVTNARCDLREVGSFTLQNEWLQRYELHICGVDLVATDDLDTECEGLTPIALYESETLDDDAAIATLTGFFANYANNGAGRTLYASELNPLTKACASEIGDHNLNDVADVREVQGMDPPDGVTFSSRELVWVQMSYFIELHDAYFETRPLEDYDTYVIAEHTRCDTDAADRPFALGYETPGPSDYWRECSRSRSNDYDASADATGYDFAQYTCDSSAGPCELPSIPLDEASRRGDALVAHGLCSGADLPLEDETWRGMNHASQFQCVVLSDFPTETWEYDVEDAEAQLDGDFNVCGVACSSGDATCATDCADGVCESSLSEDGNPSRVKLACERQSSLNAGDVGFLAYTFDEAGVDAYTYERGCIDEWEVWPELCPGWVDVSVTGGFQLATGDGLDNDFGKLICGCGENYGGEDCTIGCPLAGVSDDFGVRAGWWVCPSLPTSSFETLDDTYGDSFVGSVDGVGTYVMTSDVPQSTIERSRLCQEDDCSTGFVVR